MRVLARRVCVPTMLLGLLLIAPSVDAQVAGAPNPLRRDDQVQPAPGQQPAATAPATQPAAAPADGQVNVTSNGDAETAEVSLLEPMKKDALTARLDRLAGLGLDDDQLQAATENYNQALKSRNTAYTLGQSTAEKRKRLENRPQAVLDARKKLDEPLPAPPPLPNKLPDLEALVMQLEQQVQDLQAVREQKLTLKTTRTAQVSQIPSELTDAQAQLRDVEEQIADKSSLTPDSDETDVSALIALVNRREALQRKIANLQVEQQLASSTELLQLELDLIDRELGAKEKQLAQARAERNLLQQAEADRQAKEAAKAAAVKRPKAIAELADLNAKLAEDQKEQTARTNALEDELRKRKTQFETVNKQFENTSTRIGEELSVSAGKLLLMQKKDLPHSRQLRDDAEERNEINDRLLFDLYEAQDRREELSDMESRVDAVMAEVKGQGISEADVRKLLEDQRTYLDGLVDSYTNYSRTLAELAAKEVALADLTDKFSEYIAERVLWIRSNPALSVNDLGPAADAARWSLDPLKWRDAGMAVWHSFIERPASSIALLAAIVALLAIQRGARQRLREIGAAAEKRTCAEFTPSLRALGLTLLISLPWPAFIWLLGWSMDNPSVTSDFVRSLSGSTRIVAKCLLLLELIRALCRGSGLADAHFDWPDACLVQVRRHVRWLTMAGLPLLLWTAGLELQETEALYGASLGRALFIVLMLLVAYRLERMLLGRKSPFRQLLHSDGWLAPLQYVWRPAVVALPAALALLAAVGFYFSAQQAAAKLVQSVVLMLVVLVVGGLTRRWVLTSRRSLAREQAKQRRAQLAAAAAAAAAAENEGNDSPAPAGELPTTELIDETVDLAALGEQTQTLVRTLLAALLITGLYLIWNELLPAMAYLGDSAILGFELTWSQLLKFAIVLVFTYVAVRDIPALLELAILQRLPLDSGSRYALTTITRYVIAAIGIAAAYGALGYKGENIQWLVAAMGVGLGFGLQEIFANFVSGIILLFERPIRVGDVVTLGDKTGAVTRIRMRATTIVDWDRKEYIVPNKDLVTERLLNWTLTDQTNRIVVNVGIAYGADTDAACRLLIDAAREQPTVMDDPPPVATFESFGDSSLNLTLRAYLPSLENRLATIHALHTLIDRKFREAGVEIPFPQRDLNLRNVPSGWLDEIAAAQPRAATSNGHANGASAAGGGEEKASQKSHEGL
ncbi:MAG: mechanosensitive ion channel [Planctomycetales bacterium]|nr:mechanosensitive ion channel [Planctomycetales bacterium]